MYQAAPQDVKTTLSKLRTSILKHDEDKALELIDHMDSTILCSLDDSYGSLLQLAAAAHTEGSKVLVKLMSKCPHLLLEERTGRFNGQTPFHTLVSKGDVRAVRNIVSNNPFKKYCGLLMTVCSDGTSFDGTVMMGQLPLTIAALTLNNKMVDALLEFDTDFKLLPSSNKKGDTVFHSLIRYSCLYPEEELNVQNMMRYLHHHFREEPPRSLWRISNHDGRTPLTLAAQLAQSRLFTFILKLEGVYSELNGQDGLFDYLNYDITEIDPAAARDAKNRAETEREQIRNGKTQAKDTFGAETEQQLRNGRNQAKDTFRAGTEQQLRESSTQVQETTGTASCSPVDFSSKAAFQSVLEIVCGSPRVDRAFKILDNHVVKQVVREKWHKYRRWFYAWGILHVSLMASLTAYAVCKAQAIISHRNARTSLGQNVQNISQLHESMVLAASVLFFLLSLLLFAWEALRIVRRHPYYLQLPHHNGLYRVQLILFAVGLFGDAVWYWIADDHYGNYFLILALLVGWWFTTFFLRPFKKFSFFTVMIQKVFFGDLLRFSIVILLVYLSFSVAMYIVFLPLPPPEFQGFDKTLLTMFELMLGQTDVKVLHEAPTPWLAVLLFVAYMLFTFILILNSLIALMSNTCSAVYTAKESNREMQKLAVVLFIEASLPRQSCLHIVGAHCKWQRKMFDTGEMTKEYGYAEQVASLHRVRKDRPRQPRYLDEPDGSRHTSPDTLDGGSWEHGSSADELLYCLRFQLPTNAR
ncbi:transient receptor potential cation channel subfamily V member 5-like [Littorina saxatilis]|uniref:transient receptor potential cation channel subfamily V member 5-like n=1 Tax=Littorina saxatilis TaxID=31220 RepID=UPI0038B486EB